MPKNNTLTFELAKQDGVSGVNIVGFLPFGDFADEKDGAEYTVYVDGDGKTVDRDAPGAIAQVRKATANRNFRKNITDPAIVWPDGKMRTMSLRIKANNPLNPAEYDAKKANTATERLLTQAASASVDTKRAILERLKAELGE
jgi:hypothetical protein